MVPVFDALLLLLYLACLPSTNSCNPSQRQRMKRDEEGSLHPRLCNPSQTACDLCTQVRIALNIRYLLTSSRCLPVCGERPDACCQARYQMLRCHLPSPDLPPEPSFNRHPPASLSTYLSFPPFVHQAFRSSPIIRPPTITPFL